MSGSMKCWLKSFRASRGVSPSPLAPWRTSGPMNASHVSPIIPILGLPRAGLFRKLLVCLENLATTSRTHRVTVGDQAAPRVHRNLERPFEFFRAHLRQCCRSAFHQLHTLAGFGESENFVGNNFSNGKAIVHLGALQVARR